MNELKIKKITDYIFLSAKPQKADLAIVFGTRYNEPSEKAAELYNNGFILKILVSGGNNRKTGENEAIRIKKELIQRGVKANDVLTEDKSTNSLENVLFSKELLEKKIGLKNISKIIAVVKHYHSRRALMTLKKYFPANIKIIPVPYDIYDFTRDNWFETGRGKEKVLDEWEKIPKYLAKKDIEELNF